MAKKYKIDRIDVTTCMDEYPVYLERKIKILSRMLPEYADLGAILTINKILLTYDMVSVKFPTPKEDDGFKMVLTFKIK